MQAKWPDLRVQVTFVRRQQRPDGTIRQSAIYGADWLFRGFLAYTDHRGANRNFLLDAISGESALSLSPGTNFQLELKARTMSAALAGRVREPKTVH